MRSKGVPFLLLALGLVVTISWVSCSRQHANVAMKPEDRLAAADDLFARGKLDDAAQQYETLLSEFPRPEIAEIARFNLARCRMENREYDLAVTAFREFAGSYPQSDLIDDSMLMVARCYLKQAPEIERDQARTVEALDELNLLLRKYPSSNVRAEAEEAIGEARGRLARKEYLSGQLYLRLGDFKSAAVYFDHVVSDYSGTPWVAPAMLAKAQALEGLGDTGKAAEAYRRLIEEYPAGDAGREASRRLKELEGGSEADRGSGPGN